MLRAIASRSSLGVRGMCTMPQEAPIQMYGIAGRYANALYSAAAKKKALLDVEADLDLFKATVGTSATLHNFIVDPSISRNAKVAGIKELMTSAKASAVTTNAMMALAEGGRMGEVFKVIDMYTELITAAKGDVKAIVTSAAKLSPEELKGLDGQIEAMVGKKANVSIETRVDPSLIKGMKIEVGDKFIDLSVATQLKKLHSFLGVGLGAPPAPPGFPTF